VDVTPALFAFFPFCSSFSLLILSLNQAFVSLRGFPYRDVTPNPWSYLSFHFWRITLCVFLGSRVIPWTPLFYNVLRGESLVSAQLSLERMGDQVNQLKLLPKRSVPFPSILFISPFQTLLNFLQKSLFALRPQRFNKYWQAVDLL